MTPAAEAVQLELLRQLDTLLAALADCDDESASWTPGPGANSVYTLVAHTLLTAERLVLERAGGEVVTGPSRDEVFAELGTVAALHARGLRVKDALAARLARFTEVELQGICEGPRGPQTRISALLRATVHAGEHAGQAELTRDLAKARP